MKPNDALAGWKKFPLHFFCLGVPVATAVWYGGWSGAVVLVAWRTYEEFLDWHSRLDTPGKAAIDLFSQIVLPVAVAIFRGIHG